MLKNNVLPAEVLGMAGTTPSSILEQLEIALAEPEPMCLVMVEIDPTADDEYGPIDDDRYDELLDQAGGRLQETLRRYDQLVEIRPDAWAVILRTLADATTLASRMRAFYEVVSQPYSVDGDPVEVQVALGAAVRTPQDTPEILVRRVEQAVESARSEGAVGPVVV